MKLKIKKRKLILFASLLILSRLICFKRSQTAVLMKLLLIKFKLWFSITWNVLKAVYPMFPLTPLSPIIRYTIDI